MPSQQLWTVDQARELVFAPRIHDDKYLRGVVGFVTGSTRYPGAAILGTSAAVRTGVGMVRYLGPRNTTAMVVLNRPEVVPGRGRVESWVLGSGVPTDENDAQGAMIDQVIADGVPTVVDAGALQRVSANYRQRGLPLIYTPHAGELAAILAQFGYRASRESIVRAPSDHAAVTANLLGATVLLKGHETYVATAAGTSLVVKGATPWLATAGTGDVLAGIIGALLAAASDRITVADPDNLAMLAATGAVIHAQAAEQAARRGPFGAFDLIERIPGVIAELISAESGR